MKEIKFEKINSVSDEDLVNCSVFLFFGESFLYKKIVDRVVSLVLSEDERELNFEHYDNSMDEISDLYESLSTYSFFSEKKVVHLSDSKLFYSKKDDNDFLEKSRTDFDKGELLKSSKNFLNYLSLNGKDFESEDFINDLLKTENWISEVLEFCREKNFKVVKSEDDSRVIVDVIENMLENRYFIITSEKTDKKSVVYKAVKDKGLIVDCSVSVSDRKDDRKKQDDILKNSASENLKKAGKKIDNDALSKLISLTGFKPEIFNDNIEKLIDFTGKRDRISVKDVDTVLKRTKTDPIYELTGALTERKVNESLFYLRSLLKENYHPLQILTAISNQNRKIMVARDFLDSSFGKMWNTGLGFNQFKDKTVPYIVEYDQKTREKSKEANKILSRKGESDLVLLKNPKSPYPAFLLLKNSSKFSSKELINIHREIAKSDKKMKSSASDAVLLIENLILLICGKMN